MLKQHKPCHETKKDREQAPLTVSVNAKTQKQTPWSQTLTKKKNKKNKRKKNKKNKKNKRKKNKRIATSLTFSPW